MPAVRSVLRNAVRAVALMLLLVLKVGRVAKLQQHTPQFLGMKNSNKGPGRCCGKSFLDVRNTQAATRFAINICLHLRQNKIIFLPERTQDTGKSQAYESPLSAPEARACSPAAPPRHGRTSQTPRTCARKQPSQALVYRTRQ